MTEPLSRNTQAILLLTAPLLAGRGNASRELLSLNDYNQLVRILREMQKEPADLIGPDANAVLNGCSRVFERARLENLLGRGFLLSQAVEKWNARSIWIVSRADAKYPKRIKARLREDAPPLYYGCGEIDLLQKGGLAVVGSRNVDDELLSYTESVGRLSAAAARTIVSGGARGIDRAAMSGALKAGGHVVGVLADSLEKSALSHENRQALRDRRLVLISPYDPIAGFNVGHAMQRNKMIYALADAALVVNSDLAKGGTWTGAVEQLDRLRFVTIFVRNGPNMGKGNEALLKRGGTVWPNPTSTFDFDKTLTLTKESIAPKPKQISFSLTVREGQSEYGYSSEANPDLKMKDREHSTQVETTPEEQLMDTVRALLRRELVESRTEDEVAKLLGVSKSQAKTWLAQLVQEAAVEKVKNSKPAQFRVAPNVDRLL